MFGAYSGMTCTRASASSTATSSVATECSRQGAHRWRRFAATRLSEAGHAVKKPSVHISRRILRSGPAVSEMLHIRLRRPALPLCNSSKPRCSPKMALEVDPTDRQKK
jgi:hypothetical protein